MIVRRTFASFIVGLTCLAWTLAPADAAIDSQHLGARYDEVGSKIVFRIYSSRASRVELYLYADANASPAVASYLLTRDAANVWSVTVPVVDLRAAGLNGPVFYGYRAWGPNWPYVPDWTAGSSAGFVADVDASGNRF